MDAKKFDEASLGTQEEIEKFDLILRYLDLAKITGEFRKLQYSIYEYAEFPQSQENAEVMEKAERLLYTPGKSCRDVAIYLYTSLTGYEASARRFERDLRACKKAVGPSADLVQIQGTEHYVCRDMPIEPTPPAVFGKYALLVGAGK